MGLGSAAAPLLIRACGARGTLIATGGLLVAAAAWSLPRLTAIDRTISAPGPGYALLRQVPFFRPLPFAIAEHLAAELKPATYQPGDVIIQEGEPGDRFYLIESGRARATADGRHLAELGPAGWFGEIALLRPAPRTATITATTRLHVKVLAREEFLAAVTGNPDSAQRADDVVSARLRASRQAGAPDAIVAGPDGNHAGLMSPASQSRQQGRRSAGRGGNGADPLRGDRPPRHPDMDKGPIIEQECRAGRVFPYSLSSSWRSAATSSSWCWPAVRLYAEDWVVLAGALTVVFG